MSAEANLNVSLASLDVSLRAMEGAAIGHLPRSTVSALGAESGRSATPTPAPAGAASPSTSRDARQRTCVHHEMRCSSKAASGLDLGVSVSGKLGPEDATHAYLRSLLSHQCPVKTCMHRRPDAFRCSVRLG